MLAGGASKPICMRSFEKLRLARIATQNAWAIANLENQRAKKRTDLLSNRISANWLTIT